MILHSNPITFQNRPIHVHATSEEILADQNICERFIDGWLATGAMVVDGVTFAEYQAAAQRLVDLAVATA